ncbi:hypothetical protein D3C86_1981820 [compost metagenome]
MQLLQPQRLMLSQQLDDRQGALDRTHATGFCFAVHGFDLPLPGWNDRFIQQDVRPSAVLKRFADSRAADV